MLLSILKLFLIASEYDKGTTFTISLPAFDELQYREIVSKEEAGVMKRRGWITKGIIGFCRHNVTGRVASGADGVLDRSRGSRDSFRTPRPG